MNAIKVYKYALQNYILPLQFFFAQIAQIAHRQMRVQYNGLSENIGEIGGS